MSRAKVNRNSVPLFSLWLLSLYNSITLTFNREKVCVIVVSPERATVIDNGFVLVGVITLEPLARVVGNGLFYGI